MKKKKDLLGKILKINLSIFLALAIFLGAILALIYGNKDGWLFFAAAGIACLITAVVCILIAIIHFFLADHQRGKAFLLSGIIILLIGTSSCFGIIALAG